MSGSEFDGAAAPLRMLTAQRQTSLLKRAGQDGQRLRRAISSPTYSSACGARRFRDVKESFRSLQATTRPQTQLVSPAGSSPYAIR